MSSDSPVYTFDSLEEGKNTLTIHYRTEYGTAIFPFTFGNEESGETYQTVGYYQGGRTYYGAPDQQIGVYLLKQGEEGVPFYDGSRCSHIFIVELPLDDAWELGRKLSSFLYGTAWQLKTTVRENSTLKYITYGDDYLTLYYNRHDSLKLGLNDDHRCKLVSWGRSLDDSDLIHFQFVDEEGETRNLGLSCEEGSIGDELDAFLSAKTNRFYPKSEAAYYPVTFLQAA